MSVSSLSKVFPCIAALLITSCGGDSSSPSTPTEVTPPPATPAPAAIGRVQVKAVPNPVPYSGERITDVSSCATVRNTWFYDQVLTETGGSTLTFTRRVDVFDTMRVNDRGDLNLVVPANGSVTLKTRWCSANNDEHFAESTFTGTDAAGNAITASAGVVRMLAGP